MKIETIKLKPKKDTNACRFKEITALKSIEFETMDYPEIKIDELNLRTCRLKSCQKEGCELYLNIRVEVTRKELFELLGAIKHDTELWREEDLPCKIKIGVHKKRTMDYWKESKDKGKVHNSDK